MPVNPNTTDDPTKPESMLFGTWRATSPYEFNYGFTFVVEFREDLTYLEQSRNKEGKTWAWGADCEGTWKITRKTANGYVLQLTDDAKPAEPFGWTVEFQGRDTIKIRNFDPLYNDMTWKRDP
jgi:hypothetical protein